MKLISGQQTLDTRACCLRQSSPGSLQKLAMREVSWVHLMGGYLDLGVFCFEQWFSSFHVYQNCLDDYCLTVRLLGPSNQAPDPVGLG